MLKIKNKIVGNDQPVFFIAEIGINHNGSIENAIELIKKCKSAGVDAVKFQKRTVELVYSKEELEKPRESVFGNTNGDLKRGLEFDKNDYQKINQVCEGIL